MVNYMKYVKLLVHIKAFDFKETKFDDKGLKLYDKKINGNYFIETLAGLLKINHDDFIVYGTDNERYPVKRDIFFKIYKKAEMQ